mgnify:CR=1 FL=1
MDWWGKPWAEKIGDPHLHKCMCGHTWVAPLQPASAKSHPCPCCTDADGHSILERQVIAQARGVIEAYGLDVVMSKKI